MQTLERFLGDADVRYPKSSKLSYRFIFDMPFHHHDAIDTNKSECEVKSSKIFAIFACL